MEDKKCIRCSENCSYCLVENECSYCNNSYGFDENKKCRSCKIENCEYCNEDFSKCEGCFSGFYYDTILNLFITNCSDPNCTSCSRSDSRKCFDCKKGTYLNEDKCNIRNDHCIDCTIIRGNYYCLNCETGFTIVNKTCKKCLSSNCALCEKTMFINVQFVNLVILVLVVNVSNAMLKIVQTFQLLLMFG